MSFFDQHPMAYPVRVFRGTCTEVHDGDTVSVLADLGFRVAAEVSVRVRGVNAPELWTPEGKIVRDAVKDRIEGKPILLSPYRDRQSFARWVGDVQFYAADGTWRDLADWLVAEGLAVRVKV